MPTLGVTELIIVLVLVIMVFGASRLGDVGAALKRSVRDFRREVSANKPDRTEALPPGSGA